MSKLSNRVGWLIVALSAAMIMVVLPVHGLVQLTQTDPSLATYAEQNALAPSDGIAVTMTTDVSDPTNQSPFTITAVFSEVVTGFNDQDLVITNGVVGDVTPLGASDVFSFPITPQTDGLVTVVITAGAGLVTETGDTSLPATLTITYDGTPPGIQLASGALNNGDVTALATVSLTATFNEIVTGFIAADLSGENGDIADFTTIAADTYTFNILPQANGPVTVTVPPSVTTDLAGNPNTASAPFTFTYNSDADPLTVLLETPITSPTNETAVPFTATFSSPAMGLAATEIDVGNGTAGNLTEIDGATYTFHVSPTANATVTVQIPAGVAETEAGTLNDASNIVRFTFDDAPPVITPTGPLTLTHLINTPYTDPGAAAADNIDGVLDPAAINIDDTAVNTITLGLYPVTYTVSDTAGNLATAIRSVQVINHFTYLPLITKPYNVTGEIILNADNHVAGQTTFIPSAELDFTALTFPTGSQPDEIRVWIVGDAIPDWEPYNGDNYQMALNSEQYGAQIIKVQFQNNGARSNTLSLVVFYIPNGDFATGDLSGWQTVTELSLGVTNGKLRLGDEDYNCDNGVPLGKASASLNLILPENGDYILHVSGTLYTEDQNPNNTDSYDAFEIKLNNNLVQRFSSPDGPISCAFDIKTEPITFQHPLPNNDNSATLSLENWSRFDKYFNTYTDIEQVWVTRN